MRIINGVFDAEKPPVPSPKQTTPSVARHSMKSPTRKKTKTKWMNQLGAMQMEKEWRVLRTAIFSHGFDPRHGSYPSFSFRRDSSGALACARLDQSLMVLNVDMPDDVLEFFGRKTKGMLPWTLSHATVRTLLLMRVEFPDAAIDAAMSRILDEHNTIITTP
jgi:hypothetical protein